MNPHESENGQQLPTALPFTAEWAIVTVDPVQPDTVVIPRRMRRKCYRFVIDVEVNPDVVRLGRNPRAWPAAIIRQHLRTTLKTLRGYLSTQITWVSGYRRDVPDGDLR